MNYSFSTVLMTILASNLVIILITLCFRFEKLLLTIGYRLLAVFLVLTLIRLLFPFELMFTKSVYLPESVSAGITFFRQSLFGEDTIATNYPHLISLWFFFECTWIVGCCIKLFRHVRDYLVALHHIRNHGRDISRTEPIQNILREICGKRHKRFHVVSITGLKTPQIFGIHSPYILIPDSAALSREDWRFVLQHETFHYFHHDLLIKEGVNLLCILYWWNPACKVLQKQVDLILEMHVDDSLSKGDPVTISAYLHTLLRIAESVTDDTSAVSSSLTVSAIGEDEDELVRRFQMLCRKSSRAKIPLFLGLLAVVISAYTCSYLFILEPSTSSVIEATTETLGLTEGFYAVPKSDGTFDIYYDNILIETVRSLEYYREIPLLPAK